MHFRCPAVHCKTMRPKLLPKQARSPWQIKDALQAVNNIPWQPSGAFCPHSLCCDAKEELQVPSGTLHRNDRVNPEVRDCLRPSWPVVSQPKEMWLNVTSGTSGSAVSLQSLNAQRNRYPSRNRTGMLSNQRLHD